MRENSASIILTGIELDKDFVLTATHPLRFLRRGDIVTQNNVPPSRTLLELLREDLQACGTKEGCGEGDCGACTVVLGERRSDGRLHLKAVNSCIRLAHSIDGMALWTVEDLQADPLIQRAACDAPHPVQGAMRAAHASQCGFCTPGFVMSLFAQYHAPGDARCHAQPTTPSARPPSLTREQALHSLSGNLCRCTGYRPIVEAACRMHEHPPATLDHERILQKLEQMDEQGRSPPTHSSYISPDSLPQLLRARRDVRSAQLVAGCTDVGLWVTKQHRVFDTILDLTRVRDLQRIEHHPHHIAIGAAVSLQEAYAALCAERPQLAEFAHRFAGLPVRNAGTLGGNVANGSPIGDSMPLLIALGAQAILMRMDRRGAIHHRHVPIEALYTGYRQHVIASDELLAWVVVPRPTAGELLRVDKVSKRREDDISAVCLAVCLHLDPHGRITQARIGAGGVAATPARALRTEQALQDRGLSADAIATAAAVLQAEFTPLSDMRASAAYRRHVLGALMQRVWLSHQGQIPIDLQALQPTAPEGAQP